MRFARLLLLLALSLQGAFAQDFFGSVADFLDGVYGIDKNAGLTAFPVLNVPMGGRAEGMAGAFAAVADDISYIEFNPAGSAMLKYTEIAFFHNNWIADAKMESAIFTTRFGDYGIGAGAKWLYAPFTQYNHYGKSISDGYYSEGVVILNGSRNFFPGYYFGGISIGVSLKGAFRLMPDYADYKTDEVISGSGMDQSAFMGMLDVGALTRFNFLKFYNAREQNMSAAFVIRNIGPPSLGEPLPTVANAAIAYKPIRPLLFSLDLYLPINLTDIGLSELPYGAFGVSGQITSFLSMRAGFRMKAGASRITVGSEVKIHDFAIDLNYTLDMLTQASPVDRISIGVRYNMGDKGRKLIADRVDDLYLLGMEAYSRGNIADAKLCWEEALSIDPGYDPAKEGIMMLENREALIRKIEDVFLLDF